MSQKVIWKPQPKQALALSCPATELFYGGAAGGGKSDFLLMDFVQGAAKYGKDWKGILIRQTNPQLEQLQQRAKELYIPLGAEYKSIASGDSSNTWHFPNGATLKMRYLAGVNDLDNYQGHEYTWVGIDELGNYPDPLFWTFMLSRCRNTKGIPVYIRGTGNPGGRGHGWIKQRFIDGHEPNKIYKRQTGEGRYITSCFIPATLTDNKILETSDPNYRANLLALPPHLAKAMLYGDWNVFPNQIFGEFRVDKHVVKPYSLQDGAWFKFCSMDWGYTKPFCIGWYAVNTDGKVVKYREWYGCVPGSPNTGIKLSSKEVARKAWEQSVTEGVDTMVADPAIWHKADDGPSVVDNFTEVGWNMIKGNNDRVNGLIVFHDMLTETDENGTPYLTFFNTCYDTIRTLPMLVPDVNHPEDIDTKLEDHPYDETRYSIMSEFVKNPNKAINQLHSEWFDREQQVTDWNPFDMM